MARCLECEQSGAELCLQAYKGDLMRVVASAVCALAMLMSACGDDEKDADDTLGAKVDAYRAAETEESCQCDYEDAGFESVKECERVFNAVSKDDRDCWIDVLKEDTAKSSAFLDCGTAAQKKLNACYTSCTSPESVSEACESTYLVDLSKCDSLGSDIIKKLRECGSVTDDD